MQGVVGSSPISSTRGRSRRRDVVPVEAFGVGPESFEAVELTGLVEEHVHDDVAVVDEHPRRIVETLDRSGFRARLLPQVLLHLVDDGAYEPGVRRAGDDERLDDPQELADVEHLDALALLGRRGVRRDP